MKTQKNATFVGIFTVFAVLGLLFTACEQPTNEPPKVAVTGVKLDSSSKTLPEGGNFTLRATVEPVNATNKAVNWSSSDETKVTVANGVVTAVAPGTATITVTTVDGSKTMTCAVTVIPQPTSIEVTTPPGKTLYKIGDTLDLTGLVVIATYEDDYPDGEIDIELLSISGFNSTTAGEKTITISYIYDNDLSDTFIVTVLALTKIEVIKSPDIVGIGEPLDLGEIEVEATWGDDSTDKYIKEKVAITLANTSGFNSSTAGEKTITVSYGGKTDTFIVNVIAFYTVTFNPNGGNWEGDIANKTKRVEQDTAVAKPDDPVKEGYTFGEWYKEMALTSQWNFTSDIVTTDTTLYAKWNPISYTVRYNKNSNDASGTMADSIHTYDVEQALNANGYTHMDYAFGGWNTVQDYSGTNYIDRQNVRNLTATAEDVVTLYAKWITIDDADFGQGAIISNTFNVSNYTEWDNAVYVIRNNGNDKNYIINVIGSFSVPGNSSNTFGSARVKVSIRGEGQALSLSSTSNILRIGANQTVILRGVTLQGRSNNTTSLVYLNGSGTNAEAIFTMNSGKISGNSSSNNGAGVYINNGTFTMNGGEISENSSFGSAANSGGGGVYVNSGTFIMNGGEISSNTSSSGSATSSGGGGVYVSNGTFTMNDGEITGNSSSGSGNNNNNTGGGGVFIYNGIFTMHAGKINSNTSSGGYWSNGGGVNVERGTFTMHGGDISDNTSHGSLDGSGGGVYLRSTGSVYYGTFRMYGGKITGNTAMNGSGGGVLAGGGVFIMNGGEISDNTATSGGGVSGSFYTRYDEIIIGFTMNGGKIIYNSATDGGGVAGSLIMNGGEIFSNTASNNGGGVYVTGHFRISTGIIYGSDEDTNSNGAAEGAALYRASSGTAQYGMFSGSTWNSKGLLLTTNDTIRVVDGVLQQ